MSVRQALEVTVIAALGRVGVQLSTEGGLVVPTADLSHGDYATGVALAQAKATGLNPRVLAENIVAALGSVDGVSKIEIAGPGFINFHLEPSAIMRTLEIASSGGAVWGAGHTRQGERIMVEYTDPNPFKEFHIGHLMSNAIGESIARLIENAGATVIRANYQGDVGPHVAKALWILRQQDKTEPSVEEISAAYVEGSRAYDDDSAAKIEIDAINKAIYEKSDQALLALYEHGRRVSLEHFEELYRMLGTRFDHYFFESETAPRGLALVLSRPDVFEQSDGAIVFRGEQYGLHTRVFINSAGLPTYEAKDLGLALLKGETTSFDTSLTITASEQSDYFRVVMKAIELTIPPLVGKIVHRSHGMMRFAVGKMSSRKGNVITGESLLIDLVGQARERAAESHLPNRQTGAGDREALAQQVAVAAIKYQILKQSSGKDIIFDRERALSLEGDSGPYLQYAHARACAVLIRAREAGIVPALDIAASSSDLARMLCRFPETAERAAREYEPHHVTTYLVEVASAWNRWYANEQILDGTAAATGKVALANAVRATIERGLHLLGIPAPKRM